MRRSTALAPLAVGIGLLAGGCAPGGDGGATVPAIVRAPPQTARLDWREPYPPQEPALVFGVASFSVTSDGWSARISVENRSDVGFEIGDPDNEASLQFGVMLFPDDDPAELERRNREGTLPAIRHATSYAPRLPAVLPPGDTWRGTISAPGALAGGLWLRLSFGLFVSTAEPPPGTEPRVVWFTDHAVRLATVRPEGTSARPARTS